MEAPNSKRPCHAPSVTSSIENPCSLPSAAGFNQSNIDMTISSFLSLSDLPLYSSPLSIGCSFDRVLDKVIPSAAGTSLDEFEHDRFLNRTLQLALLLYKSPKRCIRKRATLQNSISWPLLPELTIKVIIPTFSYHVSTPGSIALFFYPLCWICRQCFRAVFSRLIS